MRRNTILFIILLVYVLAAFTFWWFSLQKQSFLITEKDKQILYYERHQYATAQEFQNALDFINKSQSRRTAQYIGEGSTFIIIIFVGALIVYAAFLRGLRLSRQQNNFMLSVTHELKTPIAGIKLNLQTLQRHDFDRDKQKEILALTIQDVDRLDELCNNILFASRLESKRFSFRMEPVNLTELVSSIVTFCQQHNAVTVNAHMSDNVVVLGDDAFLKMAINNLVSNAIKYGSNEQPIEISLTKDATQAFVQVKDQGIGIPVEERAHIFKKFYRVEDENTRRTKGTGLGLFIAKVIVNNHKGDISYMPNTPKGSCFSITLPLHSNAL
jgi:signal transduction histidine kinase